MYLSNKDNRVIFKGFTLIELLVVISIIALLLSIMLPGLRRARQQAQKTLCSSNLKQQGLGVQLYATDNNYEIMPIQSKTGGEGTDKLWMHYIAPYIGNRKGGMTQQDGGYWHEEGAGELGGDLAIFRCPSQRDPFYWNWYIRYGINIMHGSVSGRIERIDRISRPADRMLIADSMDNELSYIEPDRLRDRLRPEGIYGYQGLLLWPRERSGNPQVYLVSDRHQGGSNLLFIDGSTTWLAYEDIMFKDGEERSSRAAKVRMWDYRNRENFYNN